MHSLRWLPRLATLTASLGLLLGVESAALASDAPSSSSPDDVVGPPPPPAEVRVHVTSKVPAMLQRRHPGDTLWYDVCDAPCDRPQPIAGEYRVINGIGNASEPVQLVASGPEQTMEIVYHAGSAGGLLGGSLLMAFGSVGILASAVAVTYGVVGVANPCSNHEEVYYDDCKGGRGLSGAILVVGVLVGAAGMGLFVGGLSAVKDSKATATAKPVPVREPTWLGPRNGASARPAMSAPLTFSF